MCSHASDSTACTWRREGNYCMYCGRKPATPSRVERNHLRYSLVKGNRIQCKQGNCHGILQQSPYESNLLGDVQLAQKGEQVVNEA